MNTFRRFDMLRKTTIFVILFLITAMVGFAQEDSTLIKRKTRYVILPATAYSPESGFTLGALSSAFLDLAKGDNESRMSRISLLTIITTKNQRYFALDYDLFTPKEKLAISGTFQYKKEVDRHYGIGNDATEIVHKKEEESGLIKDEAHNYQNINLNSLEFRLNFYRRLNKRLYSGLAFHFENNYNYSIPPIETPLTEEINQIPVDALVSGIGLGINYDTRKNNNNPLSGIYLQLKNLSYFAAIGSDYTYNNLLFDARYYWNPIKKQTLALRFVTDQRFHSHNFLPLYSLAAIGGKEFVRGYYEGTYRDNHAMAFEMEYRVPFFQNEDSKFWQFWHRLGFTVFASTAKVYPSLDQFNFNDFRFAVGLGGRYMLSFSQRVNLRIDIGWGLDPLSDGDKIQRSIYFFVAEAF